MPHRVIAPHPPSAPTEKPSDPIRNPGLQSAITNPSYQRSDFSSCRSSIAASATATPPSRLGRICCESNRCDEGFQSRRHSVRSVPMRAPPITIRCDCGVARQVPYGERWQCAGCGKRWNTAQIPAAEYHGILSEMRRFRLSAIDFALALAILFVGTAVLVSQSLFLLLPVVL